MNDRKKEVAMNSGTSNIDRNMQNINVANDSVVDKNLSSLPIEINENANLFKLRDKNLKHDSNNKNIYNCNQTDIISSPINLFNWTVKLKKKGHLIIIGNLNCGHFIRSTCIKKRLTSTNVESNFDMIYHLNGNLVDHWDELPDYVRSKFFNGFPEDWEYVTDIWKLFVTQGSNSDFHWPSFEYIKKGQTQNVLKFGVHSCIFCGQKCNGQIRKTKYDNNIYNIDDNGLDKENLNKYKNINDNQLPHLSKKSKVAISKNDRQNTIVINLLHKDVSKIIEISDFDNNILSSKISSNVAISTQGQNNEVINNFDKSYNVPLLKKSTDPTKSNVEETHKTSKIVLREKQNVSTESGEINDMLLQRSNKGNSEKLESNAYVNKPKIISDKMLLQNGKSLKFHNSTAGSFKKFPKSIEKNREIHHSDLCFNNIESTIKHHVSVHISEFIDERDDIKYYTQRSDEIRSDNSSNNSNSSTEKSIWKKYRNKRKMIECKAEISKIRKKLFDTNQSDVIKRISKNSTSNNANEMVSLQNRQNTTSAHLSSVKSPISENYYDTNANENAYKLICNEEIGSDDEIYNNKYNSKEKHQISEDNDIQIECKKEFPSLTINSQKDIKYLATNDGNKETKLVSKDIDTSLKEKKVEKLIYKPIKNLETSRILKHKNAGNKSKDANVKPIISSKKVEVRLPTYNLRSSKQYKASKKMTVIQLDLKQ